MEAELHKDPEAMKKASAVRPSKYASQKASKSQKKVSLDISAEDFEDDGE